MFVPDHPRLAVRNTSRKPIKRQKTPSFDRQWVALLQAAFGSGQDTLRIQKTGSPLAPADLENLNLLAEVAASQPKSSLKRNNPWANLELLADTALGIRPSQKIKFRETPETVVIDGESITVDRKAFSDLKLAQQRLSGQMNVLKETAALVPENEASQALLNTVSDYQALVLPSQKTFNRLVRKIAYGDAGVLSTLSVQDLAKFVLKERLLLDLLRKHLQLSLRCANVQDVSFIEEDAQKTLKILNECKNALKLALLKPLKD